ncbi:MAG TPA: neutral zinc metallopeptidase [Pseudonocardia sp.]|nr:neutral zinc metallopeptidase [Pseudonocardia sp.]
MARIAVGLVVVVGILLTGGSSSLASRPGAGDTAAMPNAAVGSGAPRAPDLPTTPPATVQGGAGTASDRLAAGVVTGVEQFWREQFPVQFGRRWVNIHAFYAVDPGDATVPAPCLRQPSELADQGLFCPRLDIIAWDRTGLLPRLRASYGDGAVLVALAHEIGHAVQDRLGIDAAAQVREPDRYPTILIEAMADCFAGVVVHAAVDGGIANVPLSPDGLDRALRALLTFRDPVGVAIGRTAHGDAFDRASAFQDGYRNGAGTCAAMTVHNQTFTQRGYSSLSDVLASGDLALDDLVGSMGPDANSWFGNLVRSRGGNWRTLLATLLLPRRCDTPDLARQGPARYCPSSGAVTASAADLGRVHNGLGDYASAELVASRYALAALGALGRPVQGTSAGRAAVCLTGAYTRSLLDRNPDGGFGLSPGDIDEAVRELLDQDFAARDVTGQPPSGDRGFQRIEQFRAGALGGPAGCGL